MTIIYFIKKRILRFLYKLIRSNPNKMPMVQYWKFKESVMAKVTTNKDGALVMKMEGEKEIFPGFPRGHLLFGSLSKLKHEVKNQIFNESWRKLEEKLAKPAIIQDIKQAIHAINEFVEHDRYEMVPPEKMVMPVREIWRAFSVLEAKSKGTQREKIRILKEAITYVMQEDDGYRFRLQWIVQIFNPSSWWFKLLFGNPVRDMEIALCELEQAEIVGDMKAKIRLLRRVVMLILEDPSIKSLFEELCKEMDWNKLKLDRADKFHFRGKYFKVDFDRFEY